MYQKGKENFTRQKSVRWVLCVYIYCASTMEAAMVAVVKELIKKMHYTICTILCAYLMCVDDRGSNSGSSQQVDQNKHNTKSVRSCVYIYRALQQRQQ